MAFAYRSDLVDTEFKGEIKGLHNQYGAIMPAEIVQCPMHGCTVTYVVYNFNTSPAWTEAILTSLKMHHPAHVPKIRLQ
jgi:hypothetical protein